VFSTMTHLKDCAMSRLTKKHEASRLERLWIKSDAVDSHDGDCLSSPLWGWGRGGGEFLCVHPDNLMPVFYVSIN